MDRSGRKRFAHGIELSDEALERPERSIGRTVGASATELIPEERGAFVAEGLESFHVVARKTRAAVNHQHRYSRAAAAEAPPGDVAAGHSDAALRWLRRCIARPDTEQRCRSTGDHRAPRQVKSCGRVMVSHGIARLAR
jgi:hypothetical protein